MSKIYEEYLIFDAIGMIGSVGGTLGLFIGFSFMNVITFLINTIEKLLSCKHDCNICNCSLFRKEPISNQIDVTCYDKAITDQRFLELEKRMSQIENVVSRNYSE